MSKRRSIQEVFNVVIDNGFYTVDTDSYMCNALLKAYDENLITGNEYHRALASINKYLAKFDDACTIRTSLIDRGVVSREEFYTTSGKQMLQYLAMEIYHNWSRRNATLYWQTRAMKYRLGIEND